ncbi:MAG TPA: class I SAM-dependent methyltransferase [Termitinemataceae bacterium]|nr:class I SAM-dependent methyltransferase [Termitinemataceae bacterium]
MTDQNPFYENLLEYYDEIFPVTQERIDFIVSHLPDRPYPQRILDVGCATGGTAIALARRGLEVTGIDNEWTMIQSANRKNPEPKSNARFLCMDMREVDSWFPPRSFDTLLCLGNTLVHLDSLGTIETFLGSMGRLCQPPATVILQFVNYKEILKSQNPHLPPIKTSRCRFERQYQRLPNGKLLFEGRLYSSTEEMVFEGTNELYPLLLDDCITLLEKHSFTNIKVYEDFTGAPYRDDGLGVLVVAHLMK